jgi:hypothetical protein
MIWIRELNAKAYGLYPQIVSVNDAGEGSNLSEKFPPLLNTALNTVSIGDGMPMGWALSENMVKIGMNINTLHILLMIHVFFIPLKLLPFILGWLVLELLVSKDFKSFFKFLFLLSLPLIVRYMK